MFMVVASVLLAVGLFGCNRGAQAPVAAPVVAIALPPAAVPPPPAAPAPEIRHRAHRRHYAWRSHERASYAGYSESEYEQSSREYSPPSYGEAAPYPPPPPSQQQSVWVDGYGREHYGSVDASQDENPAELSREDRHTRRSPWHGWNSDCDER
jgi:hypothetical protein